MNPSDRIPVLKTFKLFLGGGFPRSESERSLVVEGRKGEVLAHLCRASGKDLRAAVKAARAAAEPWARRSAYNRGQILYRMAEMLEGKGEEFAEAIASTVPGGLRPARREAEAAVDCLVSFAGWADKFAQVLGCRNPVAGPFHNFTMPEAVGIVGVVASQEKPLLGLVALLAPALCAGNPAVALGSDRHPLSTALLGEVCATSDVPAGVVNLLTGRRRELIPFFADHRDLEAVVGLDCTPKERRLLEAGSAGNLKRVTLERSADALDPERIHSPYRLSAFLEQKTIWHPSAT